MKHCLSCVTDITWNIDLNRRNHKILISNYYPTQNTLPIKDKMIMVQYQNIPSSLTWDKLFFSKKTEFENTSMILSCQQTPSCQTTSFPVSTPTRPRVREDPGNEVACQIFAQRGLRMAFVSHNAPKLQLRIETNWYTGSPRQTYKQTNRDWKAERNWQNVKKADGKKAVKQADRYSACSWFLLRWTRQKPRDESNRSFLWAKCGPWIN